MPCPRSGCTNRVEQTPGVGRRRKYCSEACGAKFRKYQRERNSLPIDIHASGLVDLYTDQADELSHFVHEGRALEALETLAYLQADSDRLRAVLVELGHAQKLTTADMAAHLHVSKDTITRWKGAGTRHRIRTQRPDDDTVPPDAPRPGTRHPRPAPAPQRLARADGPAAVLARALAQLHTDAGQNHSSLAAAIGVHRSYIHYIVTGSRIPSWRVAQAFATACDADPEDIRPLWDAARGYQTARPATLDAVLRGLSLAAGHPTPDHLHTLAPDLPPELIAAVLDGHAFPDWPIVRRLVAAMGGDTDTTLLLWANARRSRDLPPTSPLPPEPEHQPRGPAYFRASG
ncbi:helix-turn-helix transcriptional regulator [Streptomyces sp. NPDC051018]|uniref:helix-turn-helix transcriptional regulator n=1 Tax=Streptomyces sp. NPDC051018 TaxID=3365639 RepID=UPI00379DA22F